MTFLWKKCRRFVTKSDSMMGSKNPQVFPWDLQVGIPYLCMKLFAGSVELRDPLPLHTYGLMGDKKAQLQHRGVVGTCFNWHFWKQKMNDIDGQPFHSRRWAQSELALRTPVQMSRWNLHVVCNGEPSNSLKESREVSRFFCFGVVTCQLEQMSLTRICCWPGVNFWETTSKY